MIKRYLSSIRKGVVAGTVIAVSLLSGYALKSTNTSALDINRNCDATAIVYCGSTSVGELITDYNTRDGGRYPDIPTVYNHFGISASDVQNLGSNYKVGEVRKDGTVWVNGQQIGSGAVTAGRVFRTGSTAIPGTSAYERSTQVAFAADAIVAYIGYENGVPSWAIMPGCGNPVKWNKPDLNIEKTVRNAANTAWVENDTFVNGSTLTYRMLVKNNGSSADTNVIVKDTLPSYNTLVAGSVKVNGVAKSTAGDVLVTSGLNIGSVNAGQTVEVTFQVKVSVPTTKCGDTAFTNKVVVDGALTPPDEDTAGGKVTVVCAAVKCDSLTLSTATLKLGQPITATAAATVSGTTVTSYEFRVNNQVVQNTASKTYTFTPNAVGEYTVKVTVITPNGSNTNANCEKKLTVTQDVAFICKSLTTVKYGLKMGESTTLTATSQLLNSTLRSYEFKVNGQVVQNTTSSTYNFSADKAGEYTVSVTVITDKGSNTNANCMVKINVAENPKCPYNPALPVDSPDCKKPEVCPYNPNLPKDSPDCKEPQQPQVLTAVTPPPVQPPAALPDTGAGSAAAGLFVTVTISFAVARSVFMRKMSL
ncbi:MAG: hypothetical protein M3Q79_02980 [bacterium]|nr:hypothetical protein [bacterium]